MIAAQIRLIFVVLWCEVLGLSGRRAPRLKPGATDRVRNVKLNFCCTNDAKMLLD